MKIFFNGIQRGYTLIGTLLIVVVVAVISLYLAIEFQQKARLQRINSTAIKMQAILEAALRYNVEHNHYWPAAIADLVPDYLPESALCTGWPKNSNPIACPNNAGLAGFSGSGTDNVTERFYFLSISLPNEKLAHLLKNSIAGSLLTNTTTVTAQITRAYSDVNRIQRMGVTFPEPFYGLGETSQGGTINAIPMPSCLPDTDPHLFILPFAWNKPWKFFDTMVAPFGKLEIFCQPFSNCDYQYHGDTNPERQWKVFMNVKDTDGKKQPNNVFIYFTTCVNKNTVYSGNKIGYQ
jgi:type II secretory pathway pseudopilin PulG